VTPCPPCSVELEGVEGIEDASKETQDLRPSKVRSSKILSFESLRRLTQSSNFDAFESRRSFPSNFFDFFDSFEFDLSRR